MKKIIYRQCRNSLSRDNVKEGIRKCFTNADSLLTEAIRFRNEKKYGLAYYFAYTAREEFTKMYLLMSYFAVIRYEDIRKFWRYFRNHQAKERLRLLRRQVKDHNTLVENIYFLLNETAFQTIRQNSLYCDAVLPTKFVLPQEIFEERDSKEIIDWCLLEESKWKGFLFVDQKIETLLVILQSPKYISPSFAFQKLFGKQLLAKHK